MHRFGSTRFVVVFFEVLLAPQIHTIDLILLLFVHSDLLLSLLLGLLVYLIVEVKMDLVGDVRDYDGAYDAAEDDDGKLDSVGWLFHVGLFGFILQNLSLFILKIVRSSSCGVSWNQIWVSLVKHHAESKIVIRELVWCCC